MGSNGRPTTPCIGLAKGGAPLKAKAILNVTAPGSSPGGRHKKAGGSPMKAGPFLVLAEGRLALSLFSFSAPYAFFMPALSISFIFCSGIGGMFEWASLT
jgi:hypothetical protein